MSERSITIHLSSIERGVSVEFTVKAGKYVRVGSAAEVSVPMDGLPAVACRIGYTNEGMVYMAGPDGIGAVQLMLPSPLVLGDFQFMAFPVAAEQQVPEVAAVTGRRPPAATSRSRARDRRRKAWAMAGAVMTGAGIAAAAAAAFLLSSRAPQKDDKPSAVRHEVKDAAPPSPDTDKKPVETRQEKTSPPSLAESQPAKTPPGPAADGGLDLEKLADSSSLRVFQLEVRDHSGRLMKTGTAFLISPDGLAVTNHHVVEGGQRFVAKTEHGVEYQVESVPAVSRNADLALVRLRGTALPFLEIGNSSDIKVGAPVAVYGCPQGLVGTLSTGILSSRREEKEFKGERVLNDGHMLQITAAISPGSSGSPVFDRGGRVIGVATRIIILDGSQNLNFAVPVEAVVKLRRDLELGIATPLESPAPPLAYEPPPTSTSPPPYPSTYPSPGMEPKEVVDAEDDRFLADNRYGTMSRHADAEDWRSALRIAEDMVVKYPKSAMALDALGSFQTNLKMGKEAEATYRKAIRLNGDLPIYWFSLGMAQILQNMTAQSRVSLNRAVELDPEYALAWQLLSSSYISTHEFAKAATSMKKLRELDEQKYENLLRQVRDMGKPSAGQKSLIEELEALNENPAPREPERHSSLPKVGTLTKEEVSAADSQFFDDPDRKKALNTLGKEGLKMDEKLVAKYPKSTDALHSLGTRLIEMKMGKEAEQTFLRAIRMEGDRFGSWSYLGTAQEMQGKTEEARESWREGIRRSHSNSTPLCLLAESYIKTADYPLLWEPLEKLWQIRDLTDFRLRDDNVVVEKNLARFEELLAKLRAIKNPPPELKDLLKRLKQLRESGG